MCLKQLLFADPNGFAPGNDGNLNVVRGSHLFRDCEGCHAGSGTAGDEEMEEGWLAGRRHPITGEAMRCEQLVLPPGSLAICLGHAAHMVSPKAADRPPRLASSHFYKKRNDISGFAQPADDLPPLWGRKAAKGELPEAMTGALIPLALVAPKIVTVGWLAQTCFGTGSTRHLQAAASQCCNGAAMCD